MKNEVKIILERKFQFEDIFFYLLIAPIALIFTGIEYIIRIVNKDFRF